MSMPSLHRLALAAVVVCAIGGTPRQAVAQGGAEAPPRRTPGFSFTPGLSVGGVFDSNVALAGTPTDPRGAQGDQLFVIQPSGQLELLSQRTELSAGYRGYLRRYVDVSQLDGFDQRGALSLRRLATRRLTFVVSDSYTNVATTDEVELNGLPFSRTGSRTNAFTTGIESRLTKFTTLAVRYENTWVDFDRTGVDPSTTTLTGGWVNGVRSSLSRRLDERLTVGGEYGVRLADLNEGLRQLTFQDAGGTLEYGLPGRVTLSVAGGVSYLVDRSFDETRTGPYLRGSLTHDAERATVGVSFERSFVPSFGFGGSNLNQEVRGFIRMPLDRNRLYLQGSAAWRRSDPFVAGDLVLDTTWIRSTLGYAATRWMRVEAFHAFTRQDSRITGGEINRQRAGVQFVVSQPMRIR